MSNARPRARLSQVGRIPAPILVATLTLLVLALFAARASGLRRTGAGRTAFAFDLDPAQTASPYVATVQGDNPLSYWRLDETSGTTAFDQENLDSGAYVGSPALGQPGALASDPDPAVTFSGSSQYVSVPYTTTLNPSVFSVEAWAKPTGGTGTYRGVMSSRFYPKGWVLYAGSNNTWQFWINNGNAMVAVTGGSVILNTWAHLVGTFDGTTARLYVDGLQVASASVSAYTSQTTDPLTIGQSEPGSGFYFPGTIDEPAIYGSALSATQVLNHYTVGTQVLTATPSSTASSTGTTSPTPTPTATFSPTATFTNTPTATRTWTNTPTSTTVPTKTPTATPSATATVTSTPTPTASATPTPTFSPTLTATSTKSPTATASPTTTITTSLTATASATITRSPTPTATPSPSPTATSMATATSTRTATTTATPTVTATKTSTSQPTATATPAATTWYVSRNGNNTSGTSWTTAWNELNAIKWGSVKPGDTILLDGGSVACASPWNSLTASPYDFASPKPGQPGSSCGMLYNTTMTVGASGTAAAPITIKLAADLGHNGTAVLFGGRITSLPDCTQPSYSASYSGNNLINLINFPNRSYVTVDGTKRSGIVMYGGQYGIDLKSSSTSNIVLQNLEIFDNGIAGSGTDPNDGNPFATSGYGSDNPGIYLNGSNITIARDLIHDNGQDDIQDETMSSPESNITITDSWLYFSRENAYQPGWGFNTGNNEPCHHPDGLQTWNGGMQTGLTVQNSIIGPYLSQGLYPVDPGTGASWNNVTLNNLLFFNVWYDSINGATMSTTGWSMSNITSYKWGPAPDGTKGAHLDGIRGSGHTLTNVIVENGSNDPNLTGITGSGNLYYNTDAIPGGTNLNPLFVQVLGNGSPHWSDFQLLNFTPQCLGCVGVGASLHTLQDILTRIDLLNTP